MTDQANQLILERLDHTFFLSLSLLCFYFLYVLFIHNLGLGALPLYLQDLANGKSNVITYQRNVTNSVEILSESLLAKF